RGALADVAGGGLGDRELDQLGGSVGRTARGRQRGRGVEFARDLLVWAGGGEGKVPSPLLWIVDLRGQAPVELLAARGGGRRVERRGEERMGELDSAATIDRDQPG